MKPDDAPEENPPLPLSWGALYAIVLGALGVAMLLLWVLTEAFR